MKCEECVSLLEEFIEGGIDERTAAGISAHLSICERCARSFGELKHEQDVYAQYLLDIEATPALWTRVQAGIEAENASRTARPSTKLREWLIAAFSAPRFSPALTGALVLIAIGITAGMMRLMNSSGDVFQNHEDVPQVVSTNKRQPSPEPDKTIGSNAAQDQQGEGRTSRNDNGLVASGNKNIGSSKALPVNDKQSVKRINSNNRKLDDSWREPTPDELVRQAEQKYQAAIRILSRDVARSRAQINPNSLAQYEQALAAIDRTIADTRRAVREHPGDPMVAQYMLTAYAKKVEVLREIAAERSFE